MIVKLLFFLLLPSSLFAQNFFGDTAFNRMVEKDCEGKEFTKTEILPSLKISEEAYADSLNFFLKAKNIVINDKVIPVRFFLTTHSQIFNLKLVDTKPPIEHLVLKDAILHFTDLWKPAVQNYRPVCSYVTLMMKFAVDKINISIYQ